MMDLGAMICRPKAPLCDRCPLAPWCRARTLGSAEAYPRRAAKAERPHRHGVAYRLLANGSVALVRRPPKGLLGGMLGLPTSVWRAAPFEATEALAHAPAAASWRLAGAVEHVFTHFSLSLVIYEGRTEVAAPGFEWTPLAEAAAITPSVFAKALRGVIDASVREPSPPGSSRAARR
jgi:A/G-specific adenine glycosylase